MRFSCFALILLILIVICSVFIANVSNLINIDSHILDTRTKGEKFQSVSQSDKRNQYHLRITDEPDHLLWFLQISDIHISIFSDESRIMEFREFTRNTLDVFHPPVVLASGDLTDAKDSNHLGSRQHEREWQIYRDILLESNVRNRTTWLDIRGNHDNFNVPGINSALNMFRKYSVQGRKHKRSYMHQIQLGLDKYTFIAVDACLEPGPKRPFNFIGALTLNDTNHLANLMELTRESGSNYTIWFGHYPTSCIVSMNSGSWGLRKMFAQHKEGLAYLCGHLHTLGGAIPQMYTLQHGDFLELELGDWKDNRTYRLAAIDHGLFSFVDAFHNKWPVVLITNPKHALFHMPLREHPSLQLESTHIRVLAFSPHGINVCSIKIDNGEWQQCVKKTDNLFVLPWNPFLYKSSIHTIQVLVLDNFGHKKMISQPFSLDGSRLSFKLFPRLVLMSDASEIFKAFFAVALSICIVPLVFFRIWHCLVQAKKLSKPRIGIRCTRKLVRKFWILSTVDRIMWPIIIYCLYLTIGPWTIGEVIDGYTGFVFSWGIYVNGGYLPGSLTYLYGFFQLTLCQFPLICVFATNVDAKYCRLIGSGDYHRNSITRRTAHLPFVMIICIEVILAIFFWQAYGPLAFLIGPFRTWSVILNMTLWYLSKNVSESSLRKAFNVWSTSDGQSFKDQTTTPITDSNN